MGGVTEPLARDFWLTLFVIPRGIRTNEIVVPKSFIFMAPNPENFTLQKYVGPFERWHICWDFT